MIVPFTLERPVVGATLYGNLILIEGALVVFKGGRFIDAGIVNENSKIPLLTPNELPFTRAVTDEEVRVCTATSNISTPGISVFVA